jgi:hypothetical protein
LAGKIVKLLLVAFLLAVAGSESFARPPGALVATVSPALSAADFVQPLDCRRTICAVVSPAIGLPVAVPRGAATDPAKSATSPPP